MKIISLQLLGHLIVTQVRSTSVSTVVVLHLLIRPMIAGTTPSRLPYSHAAFAFSEELFSQSHRNVATYPVPNKVGEGRVERQRHGI
jgi:hypothetical protein